VIEELDKVFAARNVTTEHANRFRQGADLDVDAAVAVEMIDRPTAVLPKHTARMRIVDHHDRAELFGDGAEIRQQSEIAIHREHAVGDHELAL
jgi:hypothetical protein